MTNSTSTQVLTNPDRAVRNIVTAIGDAWAAGDAEAFAALYAPDATVVLPGGAFLQGRDDIRTFTAASFGGYLKGSITVNDDVQVRSISHDVAIATSLGGVKMDGETEMAADRMRRATWVLSRREGTWLIDAYTTCPA